MCSGVLLRHHQNVIQVNSSSEGLRGAEGIKVAHSHSPSRRLRSSLHGPLRRTAPESQQESKGDRLLILWPSLKGLMGLLLQHPIGSLGLSYAGGEDPHQGRASRCLTENP